MTTFPDRTRVVPLILFALLAGCIRTTADVIPDQKPNRRPVRITVTDGSGFAIDREGNRLIGGKTRDGNAMSKPPDSRSRAFVTKVSPTGATLWTKVLGGQGEQRVTGLAVDANDNVLVAGVFTGSISFDQGDEKKLPSDGKRQMGYFLAKLDPGGKVLWLRDIARADFAESIQVAVGPDTEVQVNIVFAGALETERGVTERRPKRQLQVLKLSDSNSPAGPKSAGKIAFAQDLGDLFDCYERVCANDESCWRLPWGEACKALADDLCPEW